MFRIDQIITSLQSIRNFREPAGHLSKSGGPLLITQKSGQFLVVMRGDFFERVMSARSKAQTFQDYSDTIPAQIISDFKSEFAQI